MKHFQVRKSRFFQTLSFVKTVFIHACTNVKAVHTWHKIILFNVSLGASSSNQVLGIIGLSLPRSSEISEKNKTKQNKTKKVKSSFEFRLLHFLVRCTFSGLSLESSYSTREHIWYEHICEYEVNLYMLLCDSKSFTFEIIFCL